MREPFVSKRRFIGWCLCAAVIGAGCAVEQASAEREALDAPDASGSRFVDAASYFQEPDEIDAWYGLLIRLRDDFDDICGDTFCEGDFTNYQSLRFRCSVEASTGGIGRCLWVFAASNEEIAPATGAIQVDGRIFTCKVQVDPGTDIRAAVDALSTPGTRPIRAPLPGSGRSLFDSLADCL